MNPVQIRQIYNAARQETVKSWELEQQEIRSELARLQNELHFATEQCPNRCVCIRMQMEECEANLGTNKVDLFDARCQSFIDRVDQLNSDEVEELFRRMGVVYRPSVQGLSLIHI